MEALLHNIRLAPWNFTLAATEFKQRFGCHGLAPWSFTLVPTEFKQRF
jgi:hypothetical protein